MIRQDMIPFDRHSHGSNATLGRRLQALIVGWGTVGIIYGLCASMDQPGFVLQESMVDRWLTFAPDGIWWYLSFFLFVPAAYGLVPGEKLQRLRKAMQWSALISGAIYIAMPTSLPLQPLPEAGASARLLNWMQVFDTAGNCFPSLHVALALSCAIATQCRAQPLRSAGMWLWCLLIVYSVVQTRRHLAIDALGGGVVAFMAWRLTSNLHRQEKNA